MIVENVAKQKTLYLSHMKAIFETLFSIGYTSQGIKQNIEEMTVKNKLNYSGKILS